MNAGSESPVDPRHLIFRIAGHPHAIRLLEIREITECDSIEPLPAATAFLRGVVDLRGAAVPVVELAVMLGLAAAEPPKDACVLIVDAEIGRRSGIIGLLAGSVSHVVEISEESIQPLPPTGSAAGRNCLKGVARLDGQFVPVLDLSGLLAAVASNAQAAGTDEGNAAAFPPSTEPA